MGVQSPTEIKASGGWQRCADEDVALMCDAHLAGNNAEALLNFFITGLIIAMANGIPMRLGTVDNDGYNAFSIRKNSASMRAFWVQLKANEQIAKGVRIKDMPAEWFDIPGDADMKNSMVAVIGIMACSRLMDEERFEEADKLMEHFLNIESGIVGLHRHLLICDRTYIELIGENRSELIDRMFDKEQKKFMKTMKTYPSVLRTEYAYALIVENNMEKADKLLKMFEKCALKYPYPNEITAERELIGKCREIVLTKKLKKIEKRC